MKEEQQLQKEGDYSAIFFVGFMPNVEPKAGLKLKTEIKTPKRDQVSDAQMLN